MSGGPWVEGKSRKRNEDFCRNCNRPWGPQPNKQQAAEYNPQPPTNSPVMPQQEQADDASHACLPPPQQTTLHTTPSSVHSKGHHRSTLSIPCAVYLHDLTSPLPPPTTPISHPYTSYEDSCEKGAIKIFLE